MSTISNTNRNTRWAGLDGFAVRLLVRAMVLVAAITPVPKDALHAQPLPRGAQPRSPTQPVEPPQAGSILPGALPVLAQAAAQIGIRRCYGAVTQISQRAQVGSVKQDVVLDWDHTNPDAAAFFSLTGLEYPKGAAVMSLTTIPQPSGLCAILAERISSAPVACREVARSELAGYRPATLVKAVTVYATPARPRETVTLVDAPPSCLIVRRQVEYSWPGLAP